MQVRICASPRGAIPWGHPARNSPGDPIEPDWNFNADIAECEQSGEYDDTAPDEEEEL